jgi:hypothetical protein
MDATKNFAVGQLSDGIVAADLTFDVVGGQGARFPDPSIDGAFNVVVWDTYYASASEAYHAGHAEVMRVTARTADEFTVTRAQEGTAAVAFDDSGHQYNVELGVTKAFLDGLGQGPTDLYVATLTQAGANPPAPTVVRSTLSDAVVWARTGAGVYTATLVGAFPSGDVVATASGRDSVSGQPIVMHAERTSDDVVTLYTFEQDDWTATVRIEVYS